MHPPRQQDSHRRLPAAQRPRSTPGAAAGMPALQWSRSASTSDVEQGAASALSMHCIRVAVESAPGHPVSTAAAQPLRVGPASPCSRRRRYGQRRRLAPAAAAVSSGRLTAAAPARLSRSLLQRRALSRLLVTHRQVEPLLSSSVCFSIQCAIDGSSVGYPCGN